MVTLPIEAGHGEWHRDWLWRNFFFVKIFLFVAVLNSKNTTIPFFIYYLNIIYLVFLFTQFITCLNIDVYFKQILQMICVM